MNSRFVFLLVILIINCVIGQSQLWEEDSGDMQPFDALRSGEQRFFVPILADKRSIDQKIKSLKERAGNGQFKQILFGRRK